MLRVIHQSGHIAREIAAPEMGETLFNYKTLEARQLAPEKLNTRIGRSSPRSISPTAIRWPLQVA